MVLSDRQWSKWATKFEIDDLDGKPVVISRHGSGEERYWVVECDGDYISEDGTWYGRVAKYSDRESAYEAWLLQKRLMEGETQQQEGN